MDITQICRHNHAAVPGRLSIKSFKIVTAIAVLMWAAAGSVHALTFVNLHDFNGALDGANSYAGLTVGSDGNLYGTTLTGGASDSGTVFQCMPNGTFSTLYTFSGGSDGSYPWYLTEGSDGCFYGTTSSGGAFNSGTVFKITTAGVLTTLHSFTGGADGATPQSRLALATDGNFYGTTPGDGFSTAGTVFKITPTGTLTTLYTFIGGSDGSSPNGVVQGSDGNFYGTTSNAAGFGQGSVFSVSPSGTLTTVYSFTGGSDGQVPGRLVEGADGNFYGTTMAGGAGNCGTVFSVTPSGTLTTIYAFTGGTDGAAPSGTLTLGADGNLYGTTNGGFTGVGSGAGTVFQLTPGGTLSTLYPFNGASDGAYPFAGVSQGADGSFYGTTLAAGANTLGTVFHLISRVAPVVTVSGSPNPSVVGQVVNFTVQVAGSGPCPTGTVTLSDGATPVATMTLSSGSGTAAVSFATIGSHTITASYGGDSSYTPADAASNQTVNMAAPVLTISSSPNPSALGQTVKFTVTATGTGPVPTGLVTFSDGTKLLKAVKLSNGAASVSTSFTASGTHIVSAVYAGNSYYAAATAVCSQTVNKRSAVVKVSANPSSVSLGKSVKLSVSVSGQGGKPTGAVTISDGSKVLATVALSNGSASAYATFWTAGTHTVSASYGGDQNYGASSGTCLETVKKAVPCITISPSANPSAQSQTVSVTVCLQGIAGPPTGSVTLYDRSVAVGTSS